MSADIPGLVETSTNVAIIRTEKARIVLTTSQRSSVTSEIDEILQTVAAVFSLGGAKVQQAEGYPGWKPISTRRSSKLPNPHTSSLYGKQPEVKAIHAVWKRNHRREIPEHGLVSFGPTLEGVHSPDEKIHIDTVEKFWNFSSAS